MKNRLRVVIVDKEMLIRSQIRMRLNIEENDIYIAGEFSDALACLGQINEIRPDIIISDYVALGTDVIDFAANSMRILPDVKIILIVEEEDKESAIRGIRAGIFEYLVKPVKEATLNEAVARAVIAVKTKRNRRGDEYTIKKGYMEDVYGWEADTEDVNNERKDGGNKLSEEDKRFCRELHELIDRRNVCEARELIVSYISTQAADDYKGHADRARKLIGIIRDELGLSQEQTEELHLSYINRVELGYWLQDQINEILAYSNPKKGEDSLLGRAFRYIRENKKESDTNLNTVSEHFEVTNSHMSRLFKKNIGKNYVDTVSDARLSEMIKLLNSSKMRDRDIGEAIGIYDPHYLSIWFKKVTGMSPSEYRRNRYMD